MFYAGIGARKTPKHILSLMCRVAQRLEERGFTLRSGGAVGADKAFESGATNKQIFTADDATPEAMAMAADFHPAWDRCKPYVKKLHARNCMQILGENLDTPVKFVLCWTPDGAETSTTSATGGTGQAIRIANKYGIPVFNLANNDALQRLGDYLETLS